MGVYVQTMQMSIPWECFHFAFYLVQHVAPLCLKWPMVQLFPAAWAGSMGQYLVFLSLMSTDITLVLQ